MNCKLKQTNIMTKVSIFGQETNKQEKKPIEFVQQINIDGKVDDSKNLPTVWNNVMLLIDKSVHNEDYDTMYAWDDGKPNGGIIYLGYWNDGVIR